MKTSLRKPFAAVHRRIKVRGWIALLLLAATVAALPRAFRSRFVSERRAALALKRAQDRRAAGEVSSAREEFQAALRLEPGGLQAREQLAAMELQQGHWELAFLQYQFATQMHPEHPAAWIALADLMLKSGWLEAPEAALDKAIDAAPDRAEAHVRRADVRFRLGRYLGSLQDAQLAVAATPNDAGAWALLARSAARSQGTAAGIEAADRGIAAAGQDPALVKLRARLQEIRAQEAARRKAPVAGPAADDGLGPPPAPPRRLRPDAQTDLGTLGAWTREQWPGQLAEIRQTVEEQLREKKWAEAQRTIDSARASWPDMVFGPYLLGTLELARGGIEEAEKRFSEALATAPRFPIVIAALARTWAHESGAFGAGERLMRLAERDPGLASARYMAARAYVESRDPIKAEEALRRGITLQTDSPLPYQHLADYYFGLDRAPEALEIGQQGLERFPQALDLRLMLAQITASLGRNADAVRFYEEILSRRPDLDLARYRLATLLASQEGDAYRPRFLQVVRELENDRPSDPLLLDALGWVLHRAQDTRRARELLEAAVKGAPEEPSLHFHLAAVYAQEKLRDRAREELKAALDSRRPFAERLDALRLLRENRL